MFAFRSVKTGVLLDLYPDAELQIEENSPAFNDADGGIPGSLSLPIDFRSSAKNVAEFGFLHLPESRKSFESSESYDLLMDGNLYKRGVLTVSYSSDKRYSGVFKYDISSIAKTIEGRKVTDLDLGSPLRIDITGYIAEAITDMVYPEQNFAWFSIYNENIYEDSTNAAYTNEINRRTTDFHDNNSNLAFSPDGPFTTSPQIYMMAVLKQIFAESGVAIKGDFFNDEELRTLCIYSSVLLDAYWSGYSSRVNLYMWTALDLCILKEFLPVIPISNFLLGIKNGFNVGYFFNSNGTEVDVIPLKNLLDITDDVQELTPKAGVDFFVEPVDFETDLSFAHAFDMDDVFSQDGEYCHINTLDGLKVIGEVPTYTDLFLLAITYANVNEVVLVTKVNQYWVVSFVDAFSNAVEWTYQCDRLQDYGEGKTKLETGWAPLFKSHEFAGRVISNVLQKGNSPLYRLGMNNPFSWRMTFFRGKADGYLNSSYDVYDYAGTKQWNYALQWQGDYGLYNVWWKAWHEWLQSTKKVTMPVLMDAGDVVGFQFQKQVKVGSVRYICKKRSYTLTQTPQGVRGGVYELYKR